MSAMLSKTKTPKTAAARPTMKIPTGFTIRIFAKAVARSAAIALQYNPTEISGLGVKNIHVYRKEIGATMAVGLNDAEHQVGLFQLVMSQHNRKRLVEGMATNAELFNDAKGEALVKFIDRYTVATTKEHRLGRICTLKIDTSFPDICSLIYVAGHESNDPPRVAAALVEQLWFASISMADEVQEVNKAAVKKEWDSWGESSGKKTNSSGEKIKFDEEIYLNAATDNILLLSKNGSEVIPLDAAKGYTMEEIVFWVAHIMAAATTVPGGSVRSGPSDSEDVEKLAAPGYENFAPKGKRKGSGPRKSNTASTPAPAPASGPAPAPAADANATASKKASAPAPSPAMVKFREVGKGMPVPAFEKVNPFGTKMFKKASEEMTDKTAEFVSRFKASRAWRTSAASSAPATPAKSTSPLKRASSTEEKAKTVTKSSLKTALEDAAASKVTAPVATSTAGGVVSRGSWSEAAKSEDAEENTNESAAYIAGVGLFDTPPGSPPRDLQELSDVAKQYLEAATSDDLDRVMAVLVSTDDEALTSGAVQEAAANLARDVVDTAYKGHATNNLLSNVAQVFFDNAAEVKDLYAYLSSIDNDHEFEDAISRMLFDTDAGSAEEEGVEISEIV